MFTMNFLMYLGMGLGIFTAIGIMIAGVSYLIQFIQHYKRLRVFVDEVIDYRNYVDATMSHVDRDGPAYMHIGWEDLFKILEEMRHKVPKL